MSWQQPVSYLPFVVAEHFTLRLSSKQFMDCVESLDACRWPALSAHMLHNFSFQTVKDFQAKKKKRIRQAGQREKLKQKSEEDETEENGERKREIKQ